MRKKTSLLYISIALCILFAIVGCTADAKESSPVQVGFIKKEGIIGIYDADKTEESGLVAQLIIEKLEAEKHQVQVFADIAQLPKKGLHTLCICAKDGAAVKNALQNKISDKTKIIFVGDSAAENGVGITREAFGIAAMDAIYSDMLERGQKPKALAMVGQNMSLHADMQSAFTNQAKQYDCSVEEAPFTVEDEFYTWLKTQAAESAVGILVLDTQTAAKVAQFSIEHQLTDAVSIVVVGAEEKTYMYLRLCAISGVLMDDPYSIAQSAIEMIKENNGENKAVPPLLLTRKNIDAPEYRGI